MKHGFSRIFAAACLAVLFAARSPAEDTNSISAVPSLPPADATAQGALNGYLQLQAQLHDALMALEKSREEARQSAADTDARIQSLQESLAVQRASALETAQKNQQSMFMMAGAFGLTVLAAVLFMVYLQWRAVTRLVEVSVPRAAGYLPANGRGATSLVSGAAVAESNTRLFGAVDQLQKRILELEQGSRAALAEVDAAIASGQKPETPPANGSKRNGHGDRIADMIADAQTLLNANQPEKALRLFDEALAIDPKSADALIKKGGALEKLERFSEAIGCYDRAIAVNGSATIAYLQKGGLFNRLARYDEALKCYEQALQAQEKKSPAGKAA
jgi:tetratricopeptide (TPR) repeat protein